ERTRSRRPGASSHRSSTRGSTHRPPSSRTTKPERGAHPRRMRCSPGKGVGGGASDGTSDGTADGTALRMERQDRDPNRGTTVVEGASFDQPDGSTPAPWGTVTGGIVYDDRPSRPGEAMLRWSSRAHSIEEIESELSRILTVPN